MIRPSAIGHDTPLVQCLDIRVNKIDAAPTKIGQCTAFDLAEASGDPRGTSLQSRGECDLPSGGGAVERRNDCEPGSRVDVSSNTAGIASRTDASRTTASRHHFFAAPNPGLLPGWAGGAQDEDGNHPALP